MPAPAYSRMRALDAPKPSPLLLPSIESLRASLKRARYRDDPVFWCEDKLGERLWSKQREILESVRDNRYTAVPSCYESGKSFIAARCAAWFIDTRPLGTARVITTSITGGQVKAVLWTEIARAHAKGKLPGRLNQTEWWVPITDVDDGIREELVAFGRKPAENNPTSFHGIHAPDVLVIVDEAAEFPKGLFDALKGALGNERARLLMLGNPMDSLSEFAKVCAPGYQPKHNVISISAFSTPNFTGEDVSEEARIGLVSPLWVEERKLDWGEDSPLYKSKVLAEFPENTDDVLIPLSWIKAAQARWNADAFETEECYDVELGCDVGGGNNKNIICKRKGRRAKIVVDNNNPDTMKTLEYLLTEIEREPQTLSAKIDAIGIGHGASDRAKQIATDQVIKREQPDYARCASLVIGVEIGRTGTDPVHYANYRAEGFWLLRELFKEGSSSDRTDGIAIDPSDEQLAAQLSSLKYKYSAGRIQIESKKEMLARRMPSPDRADALMLAFLKLKANEEVVVYEVSW